MRAAAIVARIFAQLKKVVNIIVPRLQVSTTRAAPFAALIDRYQLVIMQLEKWNHPLALPVGALDKTTSTSDSCPRTA